MIKLNKSGTLICADNIRCVRKVVEKDSPNSRAKRYIQIDYKDSDCLILDYGWDEYYYSTHNASLDADYAQLEKELLGD